MKYIVTVTMLLSIKIIVFAQNSFQGKAIYEWKQSSEDFKKNVLNDPKMDAQMRIFIEQKMDKMFNKTFVLNFDKTISSYKEEEKLNLQDNSGGGSWSPNGIILSYFKDFKLEQLILTTDLMSKIYNVKDSLPNYNWKIESETKQIGGYLCNKATSLKLVTKQELDEYQELKMQQEKNPTDFFEIKEPKEIVITAWYTSEIPINHGPEMYWGLPGLILELSNDKTTISCSKIVLNTREKKKIKIQKGKEISKSEFEKLVILKNKEVDETDFTK